MKKCNKCGETKPLSEYNRAGHSRDGRQSICQTCTRVLVGKKHTVPRAVVCREEPMSQADWDAAGPTKRAELKRKHAAAIQRELGGVPRDTPRPSIRDFRPGTIREVLDRGENGVRSDLRKWHLDGQGVCEFTGEVETVCDVCHIDAWADCGDDAKRDPLNTFFALALINVAMDRHGHYLDPNGRLCVLPGHDRLPTLDKLGVYDTRIAMTPERREYARQARSRLWHKLTKTEG